LRKVFADLGVTPVANSYLRAEQLTLAEPRYPLRAMACGQCHLVQLETLVSPEQVFSDYAYFSSYSTTLLEASRRFADEVVARIELRPGDRVVEVASNDGYLLQYFLGRGLDVLGVEPAANVAQSAIARGVPTVVRFFGLDVARELAASGRQARLIVANNVLAHVPALNDVIAGLKVLLAPGGLLTVEVHHLLSLVAHCQFDTIYHEHFQYFSLQSARAALVRHDLDVVDVEEIPAQGGSMRLHARHAGEAAAGPRVADLLRREDEAGLADPATYVSFAARVCDVRSGLRSFLESAKQSGRSVVCFGASAKGNTLLNVCGIGPDLVDYAVDSSPHKQGLFLPGSHIRVHPPETIRETKPDYVLLLAWNLRDEITASLAHVREWGGQFVVPVPTLQILP
jgi:SAM-dependent methyltransferase